MKVYKFFAERLMALAADAFADVNAADKQLIGLFIDGLQYDYMKMKVMRDNPATLQNAIQVADTEQNLRKRFDIRPGNQPQAANYANDEPMDISHAWVNLRCFKCKRQGHKAKTVGPIEPLMQ